MPLENSFSERSERLAIRSNHVVHVRPGDMSISLYKRRRANALQEKRKRFTRHFALLAIDRDVACFGSTRRYEMGRGGQRAVGQQLQSFARLERFVASQQLFIRMRHWTHRDNWRESRLLRESWKSEGRCTSLLSTKVEGLQSRPHSSIRLVGKGTLPRLFHQYGVFKCVTTHRVR